VGGGSNGEDDRVSTAEDINSATHRHADRGMKMWQGGAPAANNQKKLPILGKWRKGEDCRKKGRKPNTVEKMRSRGQKNDGWTEAAA